MEAFAHTLMSIGQGLFWLALIFLVVVAVGVSLRSLHMLDGR